MKILQVLARKNVRTFIPLLVAALCGLTACLSKPALKKQTFTFNIPDVPSTHFINRKRVLGIRSLKIASPFDGRSLIYRIGEFSYVRDPYAEFLEPPEGQLVAPVLAWLRRFGAFTAAEEMDSAFKPDLLIEINIIQLYGDFRKAMQPVAVLVVHCVYLEAINGVPVKKLFEQEYSSRVPLREPIAAELMAGWGRGLRDMLAEASSDPRLQ